MKCWTIPEQGLNRSLNYENKLVGDCPEMNALDSDLNKDIHNGVGCHKKGAHAYLCLWDPALQETNVEHATPSSKCIIDDMLSISNETYMYIYWDHGVSLERKNRMEKKGCRTRVWRKT
eukprot:5350908-Ditylum_brightwellii.AAC.1